MLNRLSLVSSALPNKVDATVELIAEHYVQARAPWILGFSGGKDSSALLRLTYSALLRAPKQNPVSIVYCDTGVDIPIVASLVRRTLRKVAVEAKEDGLPLSVRVARPLLEETYFVKVIGRGYPPPTNKFRWCTDRLRIDPIQRTISKLSSDDTFVLLGVRHGESAERDRTLSGLKTDQPFMLLQRDAQRTTVFAPIINYTTKDVWETLSFLQLPRALESDRLKALYREAGGECPIIRDPNGTPCGKGRFGCWTCTVVRQDRGMSGLVDSGHEKLRPLLQFRNWLIEMRDDPQFRCTSRRNGGKGPGPLTLEARRVILRRLRSAERRSGMKLISDKELAAIKRLWKVDRESSSYRAIEAR